jgi:hypothetical protein
VLDLKALIPIVKITQIKKKMRLRSRMILAEKRETILAEKSQRREK